MSADEDEPGKSARFITKTSGGGLRRNRKVFKLFAWFLASVSHLKGKLPTP
jgi:hypothetical protein